MPLSAQGGSFPLRAVFFRKSNDATRAWGGDRKRKERAHWDYLIWRGEFASCPSPDFDVFKGPNWRAFRLFSSFTFKKSAVVCTWFSVPFRNFKFAVKFLRRPYALIL